MSIKVISEVKLYEEDLLPSLKYTLGGSVIKIGSLHNHILLSLDNEEDPQIHIITDAIAEYCMKRIEYLKEKDRADKINFAKQVFEDLAGVTV